jgi:hypothetical protein
MNCEICGKTAIGSFMSPESPDKKEEIFILCKSCADEMREQDKENDSTLLIADDDAETFRPY